LRESAHRVLIRAHLAEGNLGEAVRQYDFFAGVLHESLGIAPTDALRTLVSPCR
jgi:DNA-binding SARP family transcriptional activator